MKIIKATLLIIGIMTTSLSVVMAGDKGVAPSRQANTHEDVNTGPTYEPREEIRFINKASGYCLGAGGKTKKYSDAQMSSCAYRPSQLWNIKSVGNQYHFINKASGYCLDTDGKAANYAETRMHSCANHPHQLWDIKSVGNQYHFINKASGYCLDTDDKVVNYSKTRMYSCANHPNQLWDIEDVPTPKPKPGTEAKPPQRNTE